MQWLHLIPCFFAGAFFMNAVPHVVSGAMGRPFQTPFAKPPGQALSASTVNMLWGFANFVIAYLLILDVSEFSLANVADASALGSGALMIGLLCARHFGRFHGGNDPERL